MDSPWKTVTKIRFQRCSHFSRGTGWPSRLGVCEGRTATLPGCATWTSTSTKVDPSSPAWKSAVFESLQACWRFKRAGHPSPAGTLQAEPRNGTTLPAELAINQPDERWTADWRYSSAALTAAWGPERRHPAAAAEALRFPGDLNDRSGGWALNQCR